MKQPLQATIIAEAVLYALAIQRYGPLARFLRMEFDVRHGLRVTTAR